MFDTTMASRVDATATATMFDSHAIGTVANRGKKTEGKGFKVKKSTFAKVTRRTPSQDELTAMVYESATVAMSDCVDVPDWIARNNIHVGIARGVVKSIANKPSYTKAGIPFWTSTALACQDIVKSAWTQTILEDIEQDAFVTLITLIDEGRAWYDESENKLAFQESIDSEGKRTTAFSEVYKSIHRTLQAFSNPKTGNEIVLSDLVYTDENGEGYSITMDNPLYTALSALQYDGGLKGIIADGRIVAVMKYVKEHTTAKKYAVIVKVVEGLLLGMKYDEISSKYGLSLDTIKRVRRELKDLYALYGHIELTHKPVYRFGGSLKSYGRSVKTGNTGTTYTTGNMEYIPTLTGKPDILHSHAASVYKAEKARKKALGELVAACIHNPSIMADDEPESMVTKWINDRIQQGYTIF